MFKSHLISMLVFSGIVSTIIAFIRHDDKAKIKKEGIKLFLYMSIGIIAGSWIINFL
ncbi:MAG: hypothetical protein KAS21_01950 [Candidatus Aminicenantes bacterium]|nr:hypothetical protein [Candidatus Aminicenantes bacterium]MCK5003816.1 hypothetical protein [Candidatus Aminicenantes bacterium]